MFSSRLPERLTANPVSQMIHRARESGRPLIDLTETNPTVVGIDYPAGMTTALGNPAGVVYEPTALGTDAARQAVSATYRGVAANRIVLTSSTSEAYSLLFKLLCDAGDEVLVPRPSYPLFELLTRLDGVCEVAYRLDRDGAWSLDRASLAHGHSPRTRAVLVVSPNNPTGSRLRVDDREWLVAFAAANQLALISDEVFADYPLVERPGATTLAGEHRVLTFTLGGLSKSAGLPQMKLAWIAVSGPDHDVAGALERLSLIADSYLSVTTAVQLAAAELIERSRTIRAAIHARLVRNLQSLRAAVDSAPAVTVYPPEGGWSVVWRVPAILSDDELVMRLVERHGVIVHPGYFFDIEGDGFLVTSLLTPPPDFERGVSEVLRLVAEISR